MKEELLEAFEAAKRAADAAAEAGGASPEADRCVDALRQLRKIPVTTEVLVATQVGKRLRYLTKHPHLKIQAIASDLLQFWKKVVIDETANGKKNTESKSSVKVEIKSEKAETAKVDKVSKAGSDKVDKISDSESFKAEKKDSDRLMKVETLKSEKIKIETGNNESSGQNIKVERILKEENRDSVIKKPSSVPVGPPKLTSMIKCNDPLRDKLRELLAEAFSKVSGETGADDRDEVRNILDEVDVCDPIRVAVAVESVMFEKLGRSNGAHKLKYRSIMFNLKDAKNPDLRRQVLLGLVKPEKLVEMTPEEMASDGRKLENKQIKEKALFECERGGAPKATTDQFKCGRCGQRKCTYYQMQTRSADEPMTTYVTCVNCNNHWKFC
ncbi:transcription elongation factor TFIIS-like [Phoenix dactylifera]|uniref:Transcription elongation factor n=1 Tax=Phoenix dactylifera TaxID=42345 RepID=A0A8B7BZG7_PHODC|nr:transcription elongation factor TFIIS-like [Phoenix dactylifera]